MTYEPYGTVGHAPASDSTYDDASESGVNPLGQFTNIAAAVMSVALLAGVGVWGYKLMIRDVSGIPVVRAIEGEPRIRPETPGGELALHQGLAVNAVAADGGAEAPAQTLILAPQPVKLTNEDVPLDAEAVAMVQQAIAEQGGALLTEEASTEPLSETSAADTTTSQAVEVSLNATDIAAGAIAESLRDVPGVKTSLRPQLRPRQAPEAPRVASASVDAINAAVTAALTDAPVEVDPATLPAGTRLVQLGAYDTAEQARTQWSTFSEKYAGQLNNKSRVVEAATSGGRQFFRLRAHGFEDLADARRFCAALIAEGGDCIPVVTR